MAKIKKGDFVELDYIGRIKGSNQIFDLTDESIAKKNGLYNSNMKYGPRIACIGEGDLIKGLDNYLIDKETGKNYNIEISKKEAFGDRDNKMMRVVSSSIFLKERINPFPGLQVNIDGMLGTIRSISGGRVIIDFNHPLAGKDLVYEVKINKIIEENILKIKSILLNGIGLDEKDYNIEEKEGKIDIKLKKDMDNKVKEKIKEVVKKLAKVELSFSLL